MPLIIILDYADGSVVGADAQWSADSLAHPDKSILWVLKAECGCEMHGRTFWGCPRHVNAQKATAAYRVAPISPES